MSDDIKRCLENEIEERNKMLQREWSITTAKHNAAMIKATATGNLQDAIYHARMSAECAHMALNSPCELTEFLQQQMPGGEDVEK